MEQLGQNDAPLLPPEANAPDAVASALPPPIAPPLAAPAQGDRALPDDVPSFASPARRVPAVFASVWLTSAILHMAALIALAALVIPIESVVRTNTDVTLATPPNSPADEPLPPQDFLPSDEPAQIAGAGSFGGAFSSTGTAPEYSPISRIPAEPLPRVDLVMQGLVMQRDPILSAIGPHVALTTPLRGTVGSAVTGAEGAVDRITYEILQSLEQRQTLVIWLFDQSGSLQAQRQVVRSRFDKVYEELGIVQAAGGSGFKKYDNSPLLSSIMAFGDQITLMTRQPTDNLQEIKQAVDRIANDETGFERTFTAIEKAADIAKPFIRGENRRNVMTVVFTDEAGDDQDRIDRTVAICRNLHIAVYVVGVPAPLGQRDSFIKWVDPDPRFDQSPQWTPLRQGPESAAPEMIQVRFTAKDEPEPPIDSGYGPYALTKLCYETGGIYFSLHPNRVTGRNVTDGETAVMSARMARFFEPDALRKYRPDYVSLADYRRLVLANKAKTALVRAAEVPPIEALEQPKSRFPKPGEEAEFNNALTLAQRDAALIEPKINVVYELLRQGESDRDKITEPRWQAGYDLAMGRALASKVRAENYNAMLAKAKQGLKFQNPADDTWVLKPSEGVNITSQLEKLAERARFYLNRVLQDHPDTPWAFLAQRELSLPMGWVWAEENTGVRRPPQPMRVANNPPPRPAAPERPAPPQPPPPVKRKPPAL